MNRVCHITISHNRYDDRIFQKECISLTSKYDVYLLVNDNYIDEYVDNVYIVPMKIDIKGFFKRLFSYKKVLTKALEVDAQLYHLHDPELLLIAKKLKKSDKKVIFDSHEYYYEQIKIKQYIPKIIRSIIAKIYYIYETHVCKRIDAVISICPVRDGNTVYNPFAGRCKINTYIANYPVEREVGKTNRYNDKDALTVCYAGSLSYERGITHLMKACYEAGCKLILAGSFSSNDYRNSLENEEFFRCVEYRGQCTTEEVLDIYRNSDVGAATLLNVGQYFKCETFPVKVYEYFQMKLPVIISGYQYAIDMNEKYNFGITVIPDQIESIKAALLRLKGDKNLCRMLGNNGYNLYRDKLNWNNGKELLNLYEKII